MPATTTPATSLLTPLLDDVLTPEAAERVLAYKLPPPVLDRLEVLREKAGEGELDAAERREYAGMIDEMDVISLMKLEARRLLAGHAQNGQATKAGE